MQSGTNYQLLCFAALCCVVRVAAGARRNHASPAFVVVVARQSGGAPSRQQRRIQQVRGTGTGTVAVAFALSSSSESTESHNPAETSSAAAAATASALTVPVGRGLYSPFLEHTWERLLASGYCSTDNNNNNSVDDSLAANMATAKGFPAGSVVRMENRALVPATGADGNHNSTASPIRYARAALLETLVAAPAPVPVPAPGADADADANANEPTDDKIHSAGIQVLNLVIFPSQPHWPVFGADFVSLPGNKHLLLLDAQPMTTKATTTTTTTASRVENCCSDNVFKDWYAQYCGGDETNFPWGGAMPEAVTCFVSPNALWTRLGSAAAAAAKLEKEKEDTVSPTTKSTTTKTVIEPVTLIQGELWQAFQEHLDLYLNMLDEYSQKEKQEDNGLPAAIVEHSRDEYLKYRLENDPARPMLKALYGEEWTEKVLTQVLFPPLL
jgi:hypothetical protein